MIAKKITHPAFGLCELVPTVIAIRWEGKYTDDAIISALDSYSLKLSKDVPKISDTKTHSNRDPRLVNINNSGSLSWASTEHSTKELLSSLSADAKIAWASPVYRSVSAESGSQSWFAINPTVLLVAQEDDQSVQDIQDIDSSIAIDQHRSNVLRSFRVLKLPHSNAIEIMESGKVSGSVKFENVPYISPLCCCGGKTDSCSTNTHTTEVTACTPAIDSFIPNDTFFPKQWGLERINAPRAWSLTQGDPNVVVAVLDQGVELGHPDLNMWPLSYSTITHTNDGSPVGNHGTACAGIIGAKINNALGVAGLAGKCSVMAIATNFADTEVAEGLYYAADNGARVVSMSFGVYPSWMIWDFAIIEAALQYCQDKNVVLVAASGNENQPVSRFPGSDPRTICIGGSNRDDLRKSIGDTSVEAWWGACYGSDVDVVAPCLEIPTTDRLGAAGYTPTDYDMLFNGTSSATPHVAALAGLIISMNPSLSNTDVRAIISESCDKISVGTYAYLPTVGKPYGTWNKEVGYGRINAERAVLVACSYNADCEDAGSCGVALSEPEKCCVSPCDPPWRPDAQCLFWYETKLFRVPLNRDKPNLTNAIASVAGQYIEFRITYQHKMCLLGKQHGGLLYTVTLLPGETVRLYHSDRYRRVTSEQQRYSVHTSFMQFLSLVHESKVTNKLDMLSERLANGKSSSSGSSEGGFFAGLFGFGGSSSSSSQVSVTDHHMLNLSIASEQFNQSVVQASQLTESERSVVISNFEEKDSQDTTFRSLHNANDCRAVTYFVRKVVELYSMSTTISDISWRIISPNVPPEWHTPNDIAWLPQAIRDEIKAILALLPKVGDVIEKPKPISLPTDGVVYDPELANCCSCEPQREAAIAIQLEKQKAEALKACLETQALELELQRQRMLLEKGDLRPFNSAPEKSEDIDDLG